MNTKKTDRSFFELVQSLKDNPKVEVLSLSYPDKLDTDLPQPDNKQQLLPSSLVEFLRSLNGIHLHWQNRIQDTTLITGALRILPLKEIAKDWNDLIYFDDHTSAGLKDFYPVDFFTDEACCGIFAGGENDNLYYYAFSSGEEPYNLHLNIEEYVNLAIEVKGYHYWPLILKLMTEKTSSPMIQKFHDDMAVLFPDFSVDKFIRLYEGLTKAKGGIVGR